MLLAFLGAFFACEPIVCTMEAAFSVSLTLNDEAGAPITDAEIFYTVDGEEGQSIMNFEDGRYALGTEETGDFEIEIFATIPSPDDELCVLEGSAVVSTTIEKGKLECHVDGAVLEPELEWIEVCE